MKNRDDILEVSEKIINIIDRRTLDNRPLKTSDITSLDIMTLHQKLSGATKIVALGVTAGAILESQGIEYFPMPHPSPVSRKHNNPEYIKQKLGECRTYLLNLH